MVRSSGRSVSLVAVLRPFVTTAVAPPAATPTPVPATAAGPPIVWIIVGVVGGVALIVAIALVVYFTRRHTTAQVTPLSLPKASAQSDPAKQAAMTRLFKGVDLSRISVSPAHKRKSHIP